jgi:serine protease Do
VLCFKLWRLFSVKYAYSITAALLLGGTAATLALQSPGSAQTAQNEPGAIIPASAPRPGAPMSFADLAARLQPSVVNISTTQRVQVQRQQNPFAGTPFGDLFGGDDSPFGGNEGGGGNGGKPVTREAQSLGSGFIISADGYVVTNNHVISAEQGQGTKAVVESIKVTMPDKREYKATLVGRDVASDIAVLKIDATGLPFVRFGDSQTARVGDWVVAIGNPFGLDSTVTAGIVSALHRNIGSGPYDRYIQTDASINRGNSGGPMFDLNGNVIGINTAIFSPTGGNVGIGFAIPAEQARPIVDTLRGGGKVKRGYLGVGIQPLDEGTADALGLPKNHGELISRVEPNEPAARAGIKQGDVITKVNGREVTPEQTLSFIVGGLPVGSRVPIELLRDGKKQQVTAIVGERPSEEKLASLGTGEPDLDGDGQKGTKGGPDAARESLGLATLALTPEIQRQLGLRDGVKGIVIGAVDPSSDAAAKGLQRGDIILSANQRATPSPAALATIAGDARKAGRTNVLLQVQRGNRPPAYIPVKLNQG